jgi:hypothetical protein
MTPVILLTMYTLLTAGSPDSLLRSIIPNPGYDVYVAVISSFLVFVLGFVVFYARDREGFGQLIAMNTERIRKLRKEGTSDEDIADSILSALQIHRKRRYKLARKKLVAYLREFE